MSYSPTRQFSWRWTLLLSSSIPVAGKLSPNIKSEFAATSTYGHLAIEKHHFWEGFLFEECCRLEQTTALRSRVRVFLRENRILEPSEKSSDRIIGEQRRKSREHIFQKVNDSLPASTIKQLNALLAARKPNKSELQQLKAPCGQPSPGAVERPADKLDSISDIGVLEIDLSWLNNNYQRSLCKYARKCTAHKLREIEPSHRHAALVCFLCQTYGTPSTSLLICSTSWSTRSATEPKINWKKQCGYATNGFDALCRWPSGLHQSPWMRKSMTTRFVSESLGSSLGMSLSSR